MTLSKIPKPKILPAKHTETKYLKKSRRHGISIFLHFKLKIMSVFWNIFKGSHILIQDNEC